MRRGQCVWPDMWRVAMATGPIGAHVEVDRNASYVERVCNMGKAGNIKPVVHSRIPWDACKPQS